MTLWAKRSEHNPRNIEISGTQGSIEIKVTEHEEHVRHFWGQLGELLRTEEAAEAEEAEAQDGP